ncbi:MAG: UDP-N-acetylglucosamine acyltransferase [Gammaproteobacteria bacterium]|jgi:UDP-N-acetylglucosamine acyltransferase
MVGADVEIGEGTWIGSHVVIKGPSKIGANNRIFHFCSIGEDAQDKKYNGAADASLVIGNNNIIREYCSINRGTPNGGGKTSVGDDNWIMAYCHVAHDCHVGNQTVFANNTNLAGHVEIHDFVVLGGFTGVHQFCRMGVGSFSAIAAIIVKDVPPFILVEGNTARARTLNREGLKRRGIDKEVIATLKRAYKTLYRKGLTLQDAVAELKLEAEDVAEVAELVNFIEASQRGIVR